MKTQKTIILLIGEILEELNNSKGYYSDAYVLIELLNNLLGEENEYISCLLEYKVSYYTENEYW